MPIAGGSHLPIELKTLLVLYVWDNSSTKSAEDPLRCPSLAGFQVSPEAVVLGEDDSCN